MVYVLGGWQSDFSANWSRSGIELADAFSHTLNSGMQAVGLTPKDIDSGHVGNFVGELFCQQGLLGGFFGLANEQFDGLPTSRHEAACASGSMAILAASAEIEAGRYELSCVLGIEQMRNVSGQQAADHLAAAAWAGHEFTDAQFVWPRAFSDLAYEYQARYGLKHEHLMRIAEINFSNAKRNPNAQTRSWAFNDKSFTCDDHANPIIEGLMRRQDCSQVSDGSAVVFLASAKRAAEYAARHNIALASIPRIKGWGHRSSPIAYQSKIRASAEQAYIFPQVQRAAAEARQRAGLHSIEQIDVVETHDCFTSTEYMAIDHLGITAPGESWKAIEDGSIELGGRLPINPSGGLIGLGHPVGATGVRMLLDAYKQVSNQAGEYQVEGAKNCQTLNIGGSATTSVSFVVGV